MDQSLFDTIAVCGIAGTTGITAPQIVKIQDPALPKVLSGTFALRLVNLSPDAGPISVFGTPTVGAPLGQIGLTNVSYTNQSTYVYNTPVSSNYFALEVYDATTNPPTPIVTNLNTNGFALTESTGSVSSGYTAWIVGMRHPAAGQPGIQVIMTNDTQGTILETAGQSGSTSTTSTTSGSGGSSTTTTTTGGG
jgi:hypothetical protein